MSTTKRPVQKPWRKTVTAAPSDGLEQLKRLKLKQQRAELPVSAFREEILETLKKCRTLIVVSATGSGKTTQIPQFLHDSRRFKGKIGITQPRRVAAITVANRVSQELGCQVGELVGYSVRFDHQYDAHKTKIKYVTDGMLLREALLDPDLKEYSVICLDEAHERTVNTDVLFALLKNLQNTSRPDLKLVVMSATLQARQFVTYFGGTDSVQVVNIPGRVHPVDVMYTKEPQKDYIDSAVITVCQIHADQPLGGDILVFLSGQDDIETATVLLEERAKFLSHNQPSLLVLPFYAALPQEQQMRVFLDAPPNTRKVILATNIAETSLTISGIKYVVDSGMAKKRYFSPRTGVEMLTSLPISRAEAWQRAGRAGREQAGYCFRLYTEQSFDDLREAVLPEILRSNLSIVALQLKSLGVENILSFDFMDRPHIDSLQHAIEELFALGCIDEDGNLTDLGNQLAKLPVDPKFGKALLCAKATGCLSEVLSVIALLSVESLFFSPREEDLKDQADNSRNRFASALGDHITLVNIYKAAETAKFERKWCRDHFLHFRSVTKARDIRNQLQAYMDKIDFSVKVDFEITTEANATDEENQLATVRRCLLMGLFANTARLQEDGSYQTLLHNQSVHVHPSSALFNSKKHSYVMFTELVFTSKHYLRGVSVIEPDWLPQAAPRVFSVVQKDH